MNQSSKLAYFLFVVVATFSVALPLFMQGMFLDGQQYAAVALHFAQGKGTFWHPYLTNTWGYLGETAFLEHPPLGYALQSATFKIFGESYLAERFYNLIMFAVSCGLLIYLWVLIRGKEKFGQGWLSLLFFISIGTVSWAFCNNIWEVQMALFDLLAVIFILKAFQSKKTLSIVLFSIVAGLSIAAAVLIKGVPGFFPLAAPAGLILLRRRKKIIPIQLLVVLSCALTLIGLYHSSQEASNAMEYYIQKRLLNRVNSAPTVSSHFHVLGDLFSQLIPIFVLFLISLFVKGKISPRKKEKKQALYMLYIALTATLPLLVTLVQRGFYLYPSYFYYTTFFAILTGDTWQNIMSKASLKLQKVLKVSLTLFLIVGIILTISFVGKPKRDANLLADVETLKRLVPPNETIYYNTYNQGEKLNMAFYMYVVRFSEIDPATKFAEDSNYCIQNKGEKAREGYSLVHSGLLEFDLYRKKTR